MTARQIPQHLADYVATLNELDGRQVYVTQHLTQYRRDTDGVGMGQGPSITELARAVSRELARMEDAEEF